MRWSKARRMLICPFPKCHRGLSSLSSLHGLLVTLTTRYKSMNFRLRRVSDGFAGDSVDVDDLVARAGALRISIPAN